MFLSKQKGQGKFGTNLAYSAVLLALLFWFPSAFSSNLLTSSSPSLVVAPLANEPIQPIPEFSNFNVKKITLGKKLFNDRNLSKDKNIACADCHDLKLGGVDQKVRSTMGNGKLDDVNTPTIFNVSLNSQYYWSGRFTSLNNQLDDALNELNTNWHIVMERLASDKEYRKMFKLAFASGLNKNNVKDAFVTYERSLNTPNSPFDQYLNGKKNALSPKAQRGYGLFKSYGCITCHQGVNIGGNFISNIDDTPFGIPIKRRTGNKKAIATKPLRKIRVPSLRNVELTNPYFHDGSIANLNQAVAIMGKRYTGMPLPLNDVRYIVHFLKALTGELNGKPL